MDLKYSLVSPLNRCTAALGVERRAGSSAAVSYVWLLKTQCSSKCLGFSSPVPELLQLSGVNF